MMMMRMMTMRIGMIKTVEEYHTKEELAGLCFVFDIGTFIVWSLTF